MEIKKKIKDWVHYEKVTLIGFAAMTGMVLAWEGHQYFSQRRNSLEAPRYLVAEREIRVGDKFSLDAFTFTHTPKSKVEGLPYTDQDLHLLTDATFLFPLYKGELLTDRVLLPITKSISEKIPDGRRGYLLTPDKPVPVKKGDRVDLVFKGEAGQTLIENVPIIKRYHQGGEDRLLVALLQDEISLVQSAQGADLTVLLRNPNDQKTFRRRSRRKSIQVLGGG